LPAFCTTNYSAIQATQCYSFLGTNVTTFYTANFKPNPAILDAYFTAFQSTKFPTFFKTILATNLKTFFASKSKAIFAANETTHFST